MVVPKITRICVLEQMKISSLMLKFPTIYLLYLCRFLHDSILHFFKKCWWVITPIKKVGHFDCIKLGGFLTK